MGEMHLMCGPDGGFSPKAVQIHPLLPILRMCRLTNFPGARSSQGTSLRFVSTLMRRRP